MLMMLCVIEAISMLVNILLSKFCYRWCQSCEPKGNIPLAQIKNIERECRYMQKLIVDKKFDNKKVSEYLFSKFNGLTKNTLYKAFRKKDVRINNVKVGKRNNMGNFLTLQNLTSQPQALLNGIL